VGHHSPAASHGLPEPPPAILQAPAAPRSMMGQDFSCNIILSIINEMIIILYQLNLIIPPLSCCITFFAAIKINFIGRSVMSTMLKTL
jgi:hypothetical protein